MSAERRGAARIKTRLQVQIVGVDREMRLRRGDLSVSGLFIEVDRPVGPLGSVQRMLMRSIDDALEVPVVARIVRIASVEDFWRGNLVAGVAFHFMSEDAEPLVPAAESQRIIDFVSHVARSLTASNDLEVEHRWAGVIKQDEGDKEARVSGMSLRGMVLETDQPLPVGETVTVEIPAPALNRRISFCGKAVFCTPDSSPDDEARYRTEVRFERRIPSSSVALGGDNITDAVETLLGVSLRNPSEAAAAPKPQRLCGEVSRVSLPSVLMICSMERLTGVMTLSPPNGPTVRVFLKDGEVIDAVHEDHADDPREVLREALAWESATFEMSIEPVDRPNSIGRPTSALLLQLTLSPGRGRS